MWVGFCGLVLVVCWLDEKLWGCFDCGIFGVWKFLVLWGLWGLWGLWVLCVCDGWEGRGGCVGWVFCEFLVFFSFWELWELWLFLLKLWVLWVGGLCLLWCVVLNLLLVFFGKVGLGLVGRFGLFGRLWLIGGRVENLGGFGCFGCLCCLCCLGWLLEDVGLVGFDWELFGFLDGLLVGFIFWLGLLDFCRGFCGGGGFGRMCFLFFVFELFFFLFVLFLVILLFLILVWCVWELVGLNFVVELWSLGVGVELFFCVYMVSVGFVMMELWLFIVFGLNVWIRIYFDFFFCSLE